MPRDYLLRISSDRNEEQVFSRHCYYSGISRGWGQGSVIFFARRTKVSDSILGHAVVHDVEDPRAMSEREKEMCSEKGWKWKLSFRRDIVRYPEPIPAREMLRDYRPGRLLHGYRLRKDESLAILGRMATHIRVDRGIPTVR